jgi:Catalytic LigB subunit of aromatic ring-opening dioxygenase
MIGLGLASSHAPAIFCPPEVWPHAYSTIPEHMKASQPRTAKLETAEVIADYVKRINAAFGVLRAQLEAYRPDAVIFVGDDQGDMFSEEANPAICVYTGKEVWGSTASVYMREPREKSRQYFPVHQPLAKYLLDGLIEHDFDPANASVMKSPDEPGARGTSHMIALPAPRLLPRPDIPIIPLFINEYYPPLPKASRCFRLGEALAEILKNRPERVAIYASGGLSHDPHGPRSGWIDEPLDRWVLERIATNRGEELKNMFTFDSDTVRGGTGEIRAWIVAAGACKRAATIVDYIRAHHAKTGLGFAYWPALAA